MKFQHGGGNDCEKRSCRGQPYSHVDGLSVDCRSRRLETGCTKGIDNKGVEHGSGRRPRPWFVHQLGELNLAASNPWICHPRHNDSGSSKSISASTSSSMATAGNRATPSSMRRSRNASRSASAPAGTTWKTTRGCFRDSRWIIATIIPSDRLALLPICSSPVSGLERCAIS